jgi:tetratricopeptide (TPR) repeat protein
MTDSSGETPAAAIQEKVAAGQFASALQDIDRLLATDARNREGLYMAAVCYRYLSRFEEAQACLDSLKSLSSDRGRVYQEQGHLDLARNRPQQALAAFANACQLNPALVASWRSQAKILDAMGQPEEARQAKAQVKRLQGLPKVLVAVADLLAQGKLVKAETLCRKFLRANPTHVEAMRLLADIAVQFGVLEDAEYLLGSAVEFEPGNTQAHIDLVGVLRKRQKFAQALRVAEQLHRKYPDNPQLKSLYAIEKMQMGDYAGAINLFDQVLASLPGDAVTLTSRGHALKTLGKQQESIDSYQLAIASDPWHGDAYYALSNLKTYRFSEDEVEQMQSFEQREELGPASRVHFCFALGKAFEDGEDYARSFEFYARGNRLKHQLSSYDADKMTEDLRAQRQFFSREFLSSQAGRGCDAPDPIFIVGLPRAGSTLLEQILSSHSQVDGTLELPNILSMAQKLRRQGRQEETSYPQLLKDLGDAELAALGRQYIEETRIHRQDAPFFIDKMPNNFRHIGLIKLILPNAKIIDARRHPIACCFSGFKQLFAEGQEFSYDLSDIGRYYNDYITQMDHWDDVSPGSILRVNYESVVEDLETQVRRILDYCGLPFEPACLSFYDTERAVRTASSEQVRQPIYSSGVEQWAYYRPFLAELEHILEPTMANYRRA